MYKIGISTLALAGKLVQGDPRWAALNDSFQNVELDPIEFIDAIYQGHSYSPWFNGRRKAENFICAQHIAVDLDTKDKRSTLATVEQNYFFRLYGSIIHETPSHTDAAPKCRAIFLLDEPIQSAAGYRMAIETVYQFFDGADVACIDPARFFYGNALLQRRPQGIFFTDNILPLIELRRCARQMTKIQKRQMEEEQRRHAQAQRVQSTRTDGDDPFSLLDHAASEVARTGEGGRNKQLNASAYRMGRLVAGGALDESTVMSQLEAAARSVGLPESEVAKTIRSGLRSGKQNPRQLQ